MSKIRNNMVLAGDYKGYELFATSVLGTAVAHLSPVGLKGLKKANQIEISADTVKEIKEKIEESDRSMGKSMAKEILFGIGAATANKATVLLEIIFKDGKKSLVQTNKETQKILSIACYK